MASYASEVKKARDLLTRSEEDQWALAELTYNVIYRDQHAPAKQWADDLGVTVGSVSRWAKTWKRFGDPASRVKNQTFSSHSELAIASEEVAKELVAEAERTGRSIKQLRYDRNERDRKANEDREMEAAGGVRLDPVQSAAFRAKLNAEGVSAEAIDQAIAEAKSLDSSLADAEVVAEGRAMARDREQARIMDERNRQEAAERLAPIEKAAAGLGVSGTDDMLRKAYEHFKFLVDADAEIPPRMLRSIRGLLAAYVEEAAVYAARRSIDVDFVSLATRR